MDGLEKGLGWKGAAVGQRPEEEEREGLPEAACEGLRISREEVVRERVRFLSGGAALVVEVAGSGGGRRDAEEEEDRRGRVVDFLVASSPIRLINVRLLLPRFSFLVGLISPAVGGRLVEEEEDDSAMAPSELLTRLPRARPILGEGGGAPKPRTGRELVRRSLVAKKFSARCEWMEKRERTENTERESQTNREEVDHQDGVRVLAA